ncbi:SBBP repeat-containing protein [Flavobacterium amniphilum]|uniref:SBBP repeat-containing protein n=1 Tax=Flavobacterium amniphilum TaxID=1834035 RepID=UPI00202A27EC|nr:SBBP repeat-containing protein [Flavobacterium amniphilum]MCL9805788.1 SBBP repeat-containing protein [Flavobacterium amniphilum]MCL9806375.1 SBBP repeat-containing protein [Flavobacterium amniphilum]
MKKLYVLVVAVFSVVVAEAQNFEWVKTFGSTGVDGGNASVVDAAGNVYTTGTFRGTFDADPGPGTTTLTSAAGGGVDFYITKFDASGNFVWAKKIGGSDFDQAYSMAVDNTGNIYLAGYFAYVVDFNPDAGVNNMGAGGVFTPQGFLLKLDTNGTYVWAKQFTTNAVSGNAVVVTTVSVDANNNVMLGGYFKGPMAVDSEPVVFTSTGGTNDFFIIKYNTSGVYQWAKQVGSLGSESVNGIATDAAGNVYATGNFGAVTDFDPSPVVQNYGPVGGASDCFLLKLDTSGNYQWVKSIGGGNEEYGRSVVVNTAGDIYVAANFTGTIMVPLSPATVNFPSNGSTDNVIVKFDSAGSALWAKTFGGTGAEFISSITCDSSGNVFSTGYFNGTVDFDPGVATTSLTTNGGNDVFVQKLTDSGSFVSAGRFGSTGNDVGNFIRIDANNKIITTGTFNGTCYFNPNSSSVDSVVSAGAEDGFVQKMSDPSLGNDAFDTETFRLYPNPGNGIYTVDSPADHLYSVVNVLGQTIQKGSLVFGANRIDIQNQPVGLYFLQFEKGNSLKLIKQ